jgi:hypothetical protein
VEIEREFQVAQGVTGRVGVSSGPEGWAVFGEASKLQALIFFRLLDAYAASTGVEKDGYTRTVRDKERRVVFRTPEFPNDEPLQTVANLLGDLHSAVMTWVTERETTDADLDRFLSFCLPNTQLVMFWLSFRTRTPEHLESALSHARATLEALSPGEGGRPACFLTEARLLACTASDLLAEVLAAHAQGNRS